MCKTTPSASDGSIPAKIDEVRCLLGDFSSAWDEFSSRNLYANGPSLKEQTNEYAPWVYYQHSCPRVPVISDMRLDFHSPEVLFQGLSPWVPFFLDRPTSYDSWSIGVVVSDHSKDTLVCLPMRWCKLPKQSWTLTRSPGTRIIAGYSKHLFCWPKDNCSSDEQINERGCE